MLQAEGSARAKALRWTVFGKFDAHEGAPVARVEEAMEEIWGWASMF